MAGSLSVCVCLSVLSFARAIFARATFFLGFSDFWCFLEVFRVFNAFVLFFEVCCNFLRFMRLFSTLDQPVSIGRVSCDILYIISECVSVCLCVCLCVCMYIGKRNIMRGSRLIILSCVPYGAWPCHKNSENKILYFLRG